MGFAGTWAGRAAIVRLGLLRAGVAALTLQARVCSAYDVQCASHWRLGSNWHSCLCV